MVIKAIIFDLDGVLIDTERLAFEAWKREMFSLGFSLGEEDYQAMVGLDAEQTLHYTEVRTGQVFDHSFIKKHEKVMLSILEGDLEPMPGAVDLVTDLVRKDYSLAIASNSTRQYVTRTLKGLGLAGVFSACIGREQVTTGKPAPDVYLAAAAALNLVPAQCLAVEDSLVGVKAALAAGIYCIAIPPMHYPPKEFAVASAVYDSLISLKASFDEIVVSIGG